MAATPSVFALSVIIASICVADASFAEQPAGPPATDMPAPTLFLGNANCGVSSQCIQDEIDGKLGAWPSWKPCTGPTCATHPTNWAIYPSLPPPRNGARSEPAPAAFDTPVATSENPKGWTYTAGVQPLFFPSFKPGDCFVARAFLGPVDPRSPRSPASTPVCVDGSTKVGTEVSTVAPLWSWGSTSASTCAGNATDPPKAKQVGSHPIVCPRDNLGNHGQPSIQRDSIDLQFAVPWSALKADIELVVPHGAQCAAFVAAKWGLTSSGNPAWTSPVHSVAIGQHGDSVTVNLNAALPDFVHRYVSCAGAVSCDASAWVSIALDPDTNSTTSCVSVLTDAPSLRVRQVKSF